MRIFLTWIPSINWNQQPVKSVREVTDLYLVRLHPNNTQQTYELIKCADLSKEISELFDLKRKQMYPEPKITLEPTETTEQEKTEKSEQKQKQKITNQSSMLSFFKKSYQKTK